MKLYNWIDINDPELSGDYQLRNRSDTKKAIIEYLNSKTIWQLDVKIAIARAIENSSNILLDRKWPVSKFLFYWPSGTGKTSIVQDLSELLFNDRNWYTHISCENLNSSHQTANLYGSPPWYIGFARDTPLSQEKLLAPFERARKLYPVMPSIDSIILFDEVEKMHPTITQSLLSVLDEWIVHLMDGNKSDLSKSMIFFTSNIWEKEIKSRPQIWFVEQPAIKHNIREQAIRWHFSPEFMARIDSMYEFHQINSSDRKKILKEVMFHQLQSDLEYYAPWLSIDIDDEVYNHLVNQNKDKTVRELKRAFEEIRLKLGMIIQTNDIELETLTIKVKLENGKIIYIFNK